MQQFLPLSRPLVLALALALASNQGQALASSLPPATGHSAAGHVEEEAFPDAIDFSKDVEKLRARTDVPGAVVLVLEAGEVVGWGAAGVRAHGGGDPIRITDPMHLGSCAKAMTSTLVGRLVQAGTLRWDTTIAEALPEFAETIDEGYHSVTIEALVKHQAGIAERRRPEVMAFHEDLRAATGSPREVRLEILARVLSLPPSPSEPGTFDYSNFGYMAAGSMMEALTDKTWAELMKEHVFEPLDMNSAGIGSPSGSGVPVGHQLEGGTVTALPPGPGGRLPESMGPAGLVHCSLPDWGMFIHQHLGGFGSIDGFLTPETREVLHRDLADSAYAAGWVRRTRRWGEDQIQAIDHNGSDGTWLTEITAMPELDMAIMVALNSASPGANQLMGQVMDLLLRETGFE